MTSRKQQFERLISQGNTEQGFFFRPILMHFAANYHGITYGELASDHRKLVEANIHCMEDFNTDMVGLISDPYRETSAFGAPVEFVRDGVPKCKKLIVSNMDDVRSLPRPDLRKEPRTLDRLLGAEYYQQRLKGSVPVIGWVEGPLAEACDLAGVSETLMKLLMDPGFTEALMDKCLLTAIDFAEAQIEAGCDIIGIGDAICSQIDVVLYDTYIRERHRELIEHIHSKGAYVKMHICGDINHLLPSLSNLEIDILDIDWQVDPGKAFDILGNKIIRCGNINPVVIQDSSPEEITSLASSILRTEKGKRFILSGGCEITVNTPPENLTELSKISKSV